MRRLSITGKCWFLRNCNVSWGLYLGGLKMFIEKKPGKIYNVCIEGILKLFCLAFSFSPVLTQRR